MIGERFGRLVVVEKSHSDNGVYWRCKCDCGGEKNVKTGTLNGGNVNSCGCLYVESHDRGKGEDNPSWRGGRYINDGGYQMVASTIHPRRQANGYIREHIAIVDNILGKPMPDGVQVHHYGEKYDNSKMVICQDQEYHFYLHIRQKALTECGHANWRKCKFCQEYAPVGELHCKKSSGKKGGWNVYHMGCAREYDRMRYRRNYGSSASISRASG